MPRYGIRVANEVPGLFASSVEKRHEYASTLTEYAEFFPYVLPRKAALVHSVGWRKKQKPPTIVGGLYRACAYRLMNGKKRREPQVVEAITYGSAIPLLRHASSMFAPSFARKGSVTLFAKYRNWMYSQLVGW